MMIESAQNEWIKKLSKLKEKKHRDEYGLFVVEGEKFVGEAFDWELCDIFISESFAKENDISKYEARATVHITKDELIKKALDTINPQGIAAICKQKKYDSNDLFHEKAPFIVACERVADPGNLGTIIRTAFAAGADGIALSEGCVDMYNPKVVRATAGAIFHLPILCDVNLALFLKEAREKGVVSFGTHLKAEHSVYEMDFKGASIYVIGNEANGMTDETTSLVNHLIKIPMKNGAESLNASVACGILLYEVVRQRLN